MTSTVKKNIQRLFDKGHATQRQLIEILDLNEEDAKILFDAADQKRKDVVGDGVHLRAIVEFSSACRCFCAYCGLNAGNKNISRYSMSCLLYTSDAADEQYIV